MRWKMPTTTSAVSSGSVASRTVRQGGGASAPGARATGGAGRGSGGRGGGGGGGACGAVGGCGGAGVGAGERRRQAMRCAAHPVAAVVAGVRGGGEVAQLTSEPGACGLVQDRPYVCGQVGGRCGGAGRGRGATGSDQVEETGSET